MNEHRFMIADRYLSMHLLLNYVTLRVLLNIDDT